MSSDPASPPADTPVAIAGAGPTGLALALALAVRGVPCVLLEAAPGPGRESSRASTLHAGSLELLDLAEGLGARLAAAGTRARRSRVLRAGRLVLDQHWTRVPSRYAHMLNLPQAEIERALRAELERRGGIVYWECRVLAHEPAGAATRVRLEGGRVLRARFLVGCDGAHSAVRRGLGLPLPGDTYPGSFALADAEVKGDFAPWSSYLGASDRGLMGLLPMPGGLWRLNASLPRGAPDAAIDWAALARERLPGCGFECVRTLWSAGYAIHRRSAPAMRRGRVLLAGDAAHLHSPIGGQGLNRGVRDAFDLAWRLDRILAGDGEEETLLREWERERTADARGVIRGTDALTRLLRASGGRAAPRLLLRLGARLPPVHDRICRALSTIDAARRILTRFAAEA